MTYSPAAWEQAMRMQDVILRAMSGELSWFAAATSPPLPRVILRLSWNLRLGVPVAGRLTLTSVVLERSTASQVQCTLGGSVMTFPSQLALSAVVVLASACADLIPSNREMGWASRRLEEAPGVVESRVWCNDDLGATSDLCGWVRTHDGVEMLFFGVGYRSFGDAADRVLVAEIGGLKPFVTWCGEQGGFDSDGRPVASEAWSAVANFHQRGRFGNHVAPPLTDILDAVRRHRDLQAALGRWPRCPQYWTYKESEVSVRYCVRDGQSREERPPIDPVCAH